MLAHQIVCLDIEDDRPVKSSGAGCIRAPQIVEPSCCERDWILSDDRPVKSRIPISQQACFLAMRTVSVNGAEALVNRAMLCEVRWVLC
jgi:hypothetical protein